MAQMVSPAGDMEVTFLRVDGLRDQIVVVSKFGVWDSKIYLSVGEVAHIIKLMLKPSVLVFLLMFPFLLIGSRLFGREKTELR
jgi:hypothetical protein